MTDHIKSAAQGCLGDSECSRILKMIEAVDPNDSAALDEIDARVKCYVTAAYKSEFVAMVDRGALYGRPDNRLSGYYERSTYGGKTETRDVNLIVRYTLSRDALKAIRPEGWYISITGWPRSFSCYVADKVEDKLTRWTKVVGARVSKDFSSGRGNSASLSGCTLTAGILLAAVLRITQQEDINGLR